MVLVLAFDEVIGGNGDAHLRVVDTVTQYASVTALPVLPRHEDTVGDPLRLAGVLRTLARRCVLVLTILTVEQVAGNRQGSIGIEERDLHRHDREVALEERHHPRRGNAHALAPGGQPDHLAPQHAVGEVETALVPEQIGFVEGERLIVDVQPHHLRVGCVDDGLADLGESVRLLGVMDLERLVEPVDVGTVLVCSAPLQVVAAHAEKAVADGEE